MSLKHHDTNKYHEESDEYDDPIRHFGRVLSFNSDPQNPNHYGFVEELGTWGDDKITKDRVYFREEYLREMDSEYTVLMVEFPANTIIQYTLSKKQTRDGVSYRAYDITGMCEGPLPFHASLLSAVPYDVALKRAIRHQANLAQSQYQTNLEEHVTSGKTKEPEDTEDVASVP